MEEKVAHKWFDTRGVLWYSYSNIRLDVECH